MDFSISTFSYLILWTMPQWVITFKSCVAFGIGSFTFFHWLMRAHTADPFAFMYRCFNVSKEN